MMLPEYRYHHLLRSGRQTLPATFKELQAFLPRLEEHAEACKQLSLPIAVMMAGSDTLIMPQQVQASADLFGVDPITLPDVAHDIMLVRHTLSAHCQKQSWACGSSMTARANKRLSCSLSWHRIVSTDLECQHVNLH